MRVDITPNSAFELLQAIDSRHPSVLIAEAAEDVIRLKVWIDNVETSHAVCLLGDGTWHMSTEVKP